MCVMRVTEHQDELHLLSLGLKLDPVHVLMCLLSVHENVLASEDFQMKQKNAILLQSCFPEQYLNVFTPLVLLKIDVFFRIISSKWYKRF